MKRVAFWILVCIAMIYTYSAAAVSITAPGEFEITGSESLVVEDVEGVVYLTLNNVSIDAAGNENHPAALEIANVHTETDRNGERLPGTIILLKGKNTLKSAGYYAGLYNDGNPIEIACYDCYYQNAHDICGELHATGGSQAAGIGGCDWAQREDAPEQTGRYITISSGNIVATGGLHGAGIGGGWGGHG